MMKRYFPPKEVRWIYTYGWEDHHHISNMLLWYRTRVSTRIPYHCKAYLRSIVSVVCTHLSSSLRQDFIAERGTTFQFAICSFHLVCPGVWSIGQKGNSTIARTCGHYDSQRCHILKSYYTTRRHHQKNRTFTRLPPINDIRTTTIHHSNTHTLTLTSLLLPHFFPPLHISLYSPRSFDLDSNHSS